MKEITLSNGLITLVDDSDYLDLIKFNWHCRGGYAARFGGKGAATAKVSMHRQIMDAPKGLDVDHINGNRLDNRRKNLRIVTRSVNLLNRHTKGTGFSGITGVIPDPYNINRWVAIITIGKKRHYLGVFGTVEEAAKARKVAERQYGFEGKL